MKIKNKYSKKRIIKREKLFNRYMNLKQKIRLKTQRYFPLTKREKLLYMEHALFIRGLLDPTENDLINTSNDFAKV